MERTSLAFVQAVDSSEDFREQPFRFGAAREQVAVVSVRGEEIIVRAEARDSRHAGGFLPDVEVVMPAEYALVMQRHQTLLEVADEKHPPAQFQQSIARQFGQHDVCGLIKRGEFVNDQRWN
jgi:hypothetical protein